MASTLTNINMLPTTPITTRMYKLLYTLAIIVTMSFDIANAESILKLCTTTSTENSGLLAVLNPPFEKRFGLRIDVIAVGTGKALELGANGDVDVVLVHAPPAEKRFVKQGFGVDRHKVMHNYFVLAGPKGDPAGIANTQSVLEAITKIYNTQSKFVSRGDDSGTHKKEKELWKAAKLKPQGDWYMSVGQGMGAVLRIADDKRAYTLSDKGTLIAYWDKIELVPFVSGGDELYNPYHVIAVNPEHFPHVNYILAKKYIEYLTGAEGQKIIADFKSAGQQMFFPVDPALYSRTASYVVLE